MWMDNCCNKTGKSLNIITTTTTTIIITYNNLYKVAMAAVSIGIWNNSLYSAFMKVDPILDEMTMNREKDINETIAALVGIRSTLLQLVPELTILSMYIQTTSGSPLWVNGALKHRMPPLFMSLHDARVWAIRSQLQSLNVQSRSKTLLNTVLSAEIIIYNLKTSLNESNFKGWNGFENRRVIEIALQRFLQMELNAYEKYNEWKRDCNNNKAVKLKVEIYHDLNEKSYDRSDQEEKYYIKDVRHFFVSKEIIIRFACREVSKEKGFSRLPYDIKEYLEDILQKDKSLKIISSKIQGNIKILYLTYTSANTNNITKILQTRLLLFDKNLPVILRSLNYSIKVSLTLLSLSFKILTLKLLIL